MIRKRLITGLFLLAVSIGYAQESGSDEEVPLHVREVPRHNFSVGFGVSQPMGNFQDVAGAGLNIGVSYDYHFNKNFALCVGFNHAYNEFRANSRDLNEAARARAISNYQKANFSVGPQLTLRDNRFQFDAYARAGYAFLNNDNKQVIQPAPQPSLIAIPENFVLYDQDNSDDGALYTEVGLRFNYYFRKQVQLFFNPAFASTLGKPLGFTQDADNFEINMTNLHFNIGVKISLGKVYSNGEERVDDQ